MDIRGFFQPKILDGEVAVVTGGGSGIGYAIARDLAACGAEVVITSRSTERLEEAGLRIARETGRLCGSYPCDVRDDAAVARLSDYVQTRYGPATILVNNAAANFFARAERMSRRAAETVVETDLYGTFLVTQAFIGEMLALRRGAILNITIPMPDRGFPGFAHSGAAKAAIASLTASWASEWGPRGVRVNGIGPGPVPTDGVARNMLGMDDTSAAFASMADGMPLRRLGIPEDISAAAVFLCSPLAAWITGQNLVVDGGAYLNRSPVDRD